ncbi:MAG TPA: alpha-glucuronidase family glycosyl hydrolase [Bryobacteraceae bacterium]|nr:alpha-glucuronidase family glycosyl hydrolase [Bryobacteraceae bacterium]
MRRSIVLLLIATIARAETGHDAWLRYAPAPAQNLPAVVATLGRSPILNSAQSEIIRGIRGMTNRILRAESGVPTEDAIILTTLKLAPNAWLLDPNLPPDAYQLKTVGHFIVIAAANDRGVLYGAFAFLRKIAQGESIAQLDEKREPRVPLRWINQWDNLNGAIERGYGGRSIFWENRRARADLSRVTDYGRLLASLGINGCSINNVNADPQILTPELIAEGARIAGAFRPWGVQTVLAVDFGSPKTIGGLDTFDPLDPKVAAWWKAKADELYRAIPDLGGLILKADSEGRVGPSAYHRTHADAANVIARALKPHGGWLFYRGFVYDHHLDWTNLKNDRARAAYDNFQSLDGQFDSNVVIQIKNGPIDFQVREPASPLFAALHRTNQAIELQITQEYMGQARHTVFLAPMWKNTLDFDMGGRPVKSMVRAFAGVANVGLDENWTGNHLSQANLYAFGRLAWNPDLSAQQINEEWTRLTFGDAAVSTLDKIQLTSWRTYENYTGPLGLQTLTDIVGNHFGVSVEASERNGWGQWHRADERGVGMDRTVATGTGFIGQYPPEVARIFESLETCPDDLLLFLHHVPYTYVLHDGQSVIQTIYDLHYAGAEAVNQYVREWKTLAHKIDDERYDAVLAQLEYQAGAAQFWRDAVSNWFLRESGIPDAKGRVGHYPGRIEAESMQLEGYAITEVKPWEAASGGKAVACAADACSAATHYDGPAGWYTVRVRYFDQNNGAARFRVFVNAQSIDQWTGDDHFPSPKLDGSTSTRRVIEGVALRPGDTIRIEGIPDRGDAAALDYIEIVRN